jgi:hypothetical protein
MALTTLPCASALACDYFDLTFSVQVSCLLINLRAFVVTAAVGKGVLVLELCSLVDFS